jgi:hypothetical protein
MDRMRQHVMKEFDKNQDRMISFQEFETGLNGTNAKNDQGWQVILHYHIFNHSFAFFYSPSKTVLSFLIKTFTSSPMN